MDMTSLHMPYIVAAYSFAGLLLMGLAYWTINADRQVSQKISQWDSDET